VVTPAPAGRPRFDIADIVRRHRAELEATTSLSTEQRRVLSAIVLCRTAALGGHLEYCAVCGYEKPVYNSCRNRHCPKCQALAQEAWIAARAARILPVGHFHVVFTLPSELRAMALRHPRLLYGALFSAASETIAELFATRHGVRPGMTMVLHTWTRELTHHPHIHALITAGGFKLGADGTGTWVPTSTKYLFPVAVMSELFRGKMTDTIRRLRAEGRLHDIAGLDIKDDAAWARFMARLFRGRWVVHAKRPFRRVDHVLQYLGRYTHRVGISNSRLVSVTDRAVTFRTKNGKTVTLSPVEFLRRFVRHALPNGFHKIRHFGLYASTAQDKLERAREDLTSSAPSAATPAAPAADVPEYVAALLAATGRDVRVCPHCGGPLVRLPLARAPPLAAAAE